MIEDSNQIQPRPNGKYYKTRSHDGRATRPLRLANRLLPSEFALASTTTPLSNTEATSSVLQYDPDNPPYTFTDPIVSALPFTLPLTSPSTAPPTSSTAPVTSEAVFSLVSSSAPSVAAAQETEAPSTKPSSRPSIGVVIGVSVSSTLVLCTILLVIWLKYLRQSARTALRKSGGVEGAERLAFAVADPYVTPLVTSGDYISGKSTMVYPEEKGWDHSPLSTRTHHTGPAATRPVISLVDGQNLRTTTKSNSPKPLYVSTSKVLPTIRFDSSQTSSTVSTQTSTRKAMPRFYTSNDEDPPSPPQGSSSNLSRADFEVLARSLLYMLETRRPEAHQDDAPPPQYAT